ncbi:transporter substrate-binding domain-containing protein [Modestobacter sp. VKM Ac-2979]|uniref:transporter substrate-binding domain-containing protein n=1 Tax=unclassified Modestobacter TaxID=2643866 RepID=UPI0022ABB111|nr:MULTISPECIES: transporter substrate-binding domain-containing protein [unclassified Modestobacter]MCZ2811985.1 transporter substrate-binding domain-containing protein [Modestobacter sp. VKM Ac-2979]MCZ2843709.1 transporter substrate-binding domain-containing protein [Modestobacter sp. VKM Ac-2980]
MNVFPMRDRWSLQGPTKTGAAALAGALLLSLSACGDEESGSTGGASSSGAATVDQSLRDQLPEEIVSQGSLVIAGSFDNPPVIYASAANATQPDGIAADLAAEIGERLGLDVEWRNTPFPGQLPGIDSGAFDIVWGQATQTEEREAELYDMIPFYAAPLSVLVEEGNPSGVTSFATMCGATIGGSVGSIFERYVQLANEQFCADKTPIEYQGYTKGEEVALHSGAIDAVIDTFPVNSDAATRLDGVEAIKLPDAGAIDSGLAGIVFSKTEPGLSTTVAQVLQQLHEDGTYQQIFEDEGVSTAILDADQLMVNYLTGTPAGEKQ